MPIYEYQCKSCGHTLEMLQKITEAPLQDCPSCQQAASLEKLISATSFQLKGTGWYETDFKTKKPSGAETPAATSASPETPAKATPAVPSTNDTTSK